MAYQTFFFFFNNNFQYLNIKNCYLKELTKQPLISQKLKTKLEL